MLMIMNSLKPALVTLVVLLISCFTFSQTTFIETSATFGLNLTGPKDGGHAWADFDGDGDQDVLVNINSISVRNYLMQNNDDGTFTNIQPTLAPGMVAGNLAERQAARTDRKYIQRY